MLDCCHSIDVMSLAGPWMANAARGQGSTGLIN